MTKIKKNHNDKFYTKPEIAKKLISLLDLNEYDVVIEPSAGNGSFSSNITHKNLIALDILPENDSILEMDWFEFTFEKTGKILVIGNPPFGRQGSLVTKFFLKCSEINADTIAFIVPKSFKKDSLKNKIPIQYHLLSEIDLDDDSFTLDGKTYSVPCVFQIWGLSTVMREKIELKKSSDLLEFVKKTDNPDYSFRRVGFYAGTISEVVNDKSEQSHYFIKSSNTVKEFLKNYDWEHNNTSGPKSIGKGEIISILEKKFKNNLMF